MHWAAHGHTAAELIVARADGGRPHAGMTNWTGSTPRKADATVAKSYLQPDELEALNRIVTAYLEFAELQALNRKPMAMADWITKLDDFLRLSDRSALGHAGRVSHDAALAFAAEQYERYRQSRLKEITPVERDFDAAVGKLKTIARQKRGKPRDDGEGNAGGRDES